ncbi:hypothetical protein ALC60_02305 [Trachymyrmex zeteki]|uniref:Uncharacterized protein n=1 Tax=Mycetomoellerius zeteki TaxID=64791 RepID=A0A151XEH7_9HYME|nr:hypothetical protein ALC60_02305 [Trachymyrmex zeteki]
MNLLFCSRGRNFTVREQDRSPPLALSRLVKSDIHFRASVLFSMKTEDTAILLTAAAPLRPDSAQACREGKREGRLCSLEGSGGRGVSCISRELGCNNYYLSRLPPPRPPSLTCAHHYISSHHSTSVGYNSRTLPLRTRLVEGRTWGVSRARGCSFSKARLHFLFHKRTTSNYIVRAVASACKWEKRARGDTTAARRHKSKSRIGYTPVTVFDKSVRRNDATGSDAKQNAFCFHLWHVRVRRPLYRRGTSVTRTLVEPVGSGRCLTLFPSTRPVSDAFV